MTFDPSRIHLEDLGGKGRYVYAADGETAEMTFTRIGTSQIIIDHTEVPTPFRGKGVGEGLVAHAVEAARKDNVKIRPLCPFAAPSSADIPSGRTFWRGKPAEPRLDRFIVSRNR